MQRMYTRIGATTSYKGRVDIDTVESLCNLPCNALIANMFMLLNLEAINELPS